LGVVLIVNISPSVRRRQLAAVWPGHYNPTVYRWQRGSGYFEQLDACLTLTVGPKYVVKTLEFAPKSELRALQFRLYHLFLNAVLTSGLDSSIDPSLVAAPPAKKPRNSSGPRHRKIGTQIFNL
jgi:hypothetical protein